MKLARLENAQATVILALAFILCRGAEAHAVDRVSGFGACTLKDAFLNRLMLAESGGRLFAKNPRSSALGPFQFIKTTFLEVARRNFPGDLDDLSETQILALRTDLAFSRRAADAYSRENASFLLGRGLKASPVNLRLAFFAGAAGAARVLSAEPDAPVSRLLDPAAVAANPFLTRMTARALISRSEREMGLVGLQGLYAKVARRRVPGIKIRCNLRLPPCRLWVKLMRRAAAKGRLKQVRAARARLAASFR